MTAPDYDAREARQLVGAAVGKHHSQRARRNHAAIDCLQVFKGLIEELDSQGDVFYVISKNPGLLEFGRAHGDERVMIAAREFGFEIRTADGSGAEVRLEFNAATNRFDGLQQDSRVACVPGELPQRRSALAVLAEAALAALPE